MQVNLQDVFKILNKVEEYQIHKEILINQNFLLFYNAFIKNGFISRTIKYIPKNAKFGDKYIIPNNLINKIDKDKKIEEISENIEYQEKENADEINEKEKINKPINEKQINNSEIYWPIEYEGYAALYLGNDWRFFQILNGSSFWIEDENAFFILNNGNFFQIF